MEKINVSVVIIAKNEEKKIGRCLESVAWSDDIIVVDGFSTDNTVKLSQSFGAKVIQHAFSGSFADERNLGMNDARNDWVLHLDSDEIVTEGFKNRLKEVIVLKNAIVVYKFKRQNFFLGHSMEHGGFHHYIPNLVNKKFVKFEGNVHEVPVYKGGIGVIEEPIEHRPFDSIRQFMDRQNRYTDIAAEELLKSKGALIDPDIRKNLINRSFKIFWKSYIKKQGYKEGMYGLVFAILFSFINFLKWAKYWDLVKNKTRY